MPSTSKLKNFAKDHALEITIGGLSVVAVAATIKVQHAMKKDYHRYLLANNKAYVDMLEKNSNALIEALLAR